MNALDLLIDFTSLISISVEPMPTQDESFNTHVNPNPDAGASCSTLEHSLSFEGYHSTQQMPQENIACSFASNPPTQQPAGYASDCWMRDNEYETMPPFSTQNNNHATDIFNPYRPEIPNAILPSTITSQPWPQHPATLPQWTLPYGTTSIPHPSYTSLPPQPFNPLQHQQSQTPPFQPPFKTTATNESSSWLQTSQTHFPTDAAWSDWLPAYGPFDCAFLHEYSTECAGHGTSPGC